MDLKSLRDEALEETARFFSDKQGFLPDQDSDEWEDEYRRQFALVKARQEAAQRSGSPVRTDAAAAAKAASAPRPDDGPALSGPPGEARWAAALRADRLKQIQDDDVRGWLLRSWTASKSWVETRELSPAAFRRRVEAEYAEHRRRAEEQAATAAAEQQAKADAASAIARQIQAAGITVEGLIDLVDVSPRVKAAPMRTKLAELVVEDRRLRIFETTNAAVLLVIESGAAERNEYGIERDDGLVSDLKLFAQAVLL
ncbi:MAG TPA: hypothetical protein VGD08_23175 [Stellaceae bacterium]|jgi:hypothetical protein